MGATLVDIRNILRYGIVTYSDKLDEPGAIWVVEGEDANGRRLNLTLYVISETYSVTLRSVDLLESEKDGNNDAA